MYLFQTQSNPAENQKSNQPIDELCQEENPDKDGVGQSQMEESKTGHSAQTNAPQESSSLKREREEEEIKKQKPGESDNKRSLGNSFSLRNVFMIETHLLFQEIQTNLQRRN